MSAGYNEYFLYRPIIEIVKHRQGWRLVSEWSLTQEAEKSGAGDRKRNYGVAIFELIDPSDNEQICN